MEFRRQQKNEWSERVDSKTRESFSEKHFDEPIQFSQKNDTNYLKNFKSFWVTIKGWRDEKGVWEK